MEIKLKYCQLKKKFERLVSYKSRNTYPRIVTLINFNLLGCIFIVSDRMEEFRIEQYGDEEEFTRIILDEIRPGDVFYDIGASVGLITVHACKKGALVVAFEPEDSIRERLNENLKLNRLDNFILVDWAVTDKTGTVELYTDGINGWSPSFLPIGKSGRKIVSMDTLDQALKRKAFPEPDIIKIDIEGAELMALRGMMGLLGSINAPRTIFIEIHSDYLSQMGSYPEEIHNFLISHGYSLKDSFTRSAQLHCVYTKC